MPKYVEEQFIAAAKRVGLRVEPRRKTVYGGPNMFSPICSSERLAAVQKLGKPDSEYRKFTFPQGSARTGSAR